MQKLTINKIMVFMQSDLFQLFFNHKFELKLGVNFDVMNEYNNLGTYQIKFV